MVKSNKTMIIRLLTLEYTLDPENILGLSKKSKETLKSTLDPESILGLSERSREIR